MSGAPGKRLRLRRLRLWLSGLFAVVVILFALAMGIARLALPWVASHPEKIAAMLSERLHRPVTIDRVDSHWERNGPLLNLTGLHLGVATDNPASANAQALTVASAGIKLNFFAWLRRNASFTEFRIAGVDLDVVRDQGGKWQLRGMDSSGDDERDVDDNALFSLGTLVLRDAHVSIDDQPNNRHTRVDADELRLINRGDLHRLLGRVHLVEENAPNLDIVIEYDGGAHKGRAWVGAQGLDIATSLRGYPVAGLVVNRGKGQLRAWLTFTADSLGEARVEADLSDLVLTTTTSIAVDANRDIVPHIGIDHIAFGARVQHRADGSWAADVADLSVTRQGVDAPRGNLHLRVTPRDAGAPPEYAATLDNADLGTIASVAMLVDALPEGLRRWLYAGNPEGTLAVANLRFVDRTDYDVAARFEGLAWHAYQRVPSLSGLSGVVRGDADALNLELPQHTEVAVSVPHVFRQPLEFAELAGNVAVYRTDAAWRVETDSLLFEGSTPGKTYGGELRGAVDLKDDGGKPFLDVSALITHGEVQSSHLFWPVNAMPPPAIAWLDRGLDAGHVLGGRAAFRGDLDDWPFRNNTNLGHFEAIAEVDDLRVKYLADWPAAEHAHANVTFINTTLHADISGATALSNKVTSASADIADLGDGPLDLTIAGQGSGKDLLGFVRASPLGTRFAGPLNGVDVGGQGKVDVKMFLPYKHIEDYTLDGTVQLTGADIVDAPYALKLDDASGPVKFTRSGFSAEKLTTTFRGQPATFSIAAGGPVAERDHAVEVRLDTHLPIGDVLGYAPPLLPYARYLTGSADWSAQYIADANAKEGSGQRLVVTSDLRGVAVDLPPPLAKGAEAAQPVKVVLSLPFAGADLDVRFEDVFDLRGKLPTLTTPFVANVMFGGDASTTMPKRGVAIAGTAKSIDLSGWTEFSTEGPSGDGGSLDHIELHTPALLAWDRPLGEGTVKLASSDAAIDVSFAGANIDGSINVPRDDLRRRGITVDLKKLYWPESPDADPNAPGTDGATSPLNPASIPPLHIRIGDFHLGKSNYGAATVETVPTADGMHFDQATTHSKSIDMRAHGEWSKHDGFHRSTFGIDLSAQNIGHMLDALGNGGLIDGGKTIAHIDASWAGTPSAFALRQINGGALKIDIAEGRIPDIDVGAGRLAGMLNLAALPRRLAFDFGDLFNKGYSFDAIHGVFTMTDGYAYTEGLTVASPTADMRIKGAMGLKTRDWDVVVEVTPHVSGTLMLGGALIGGPVGAAAGAVLGGILKNPINAVTRSDYRVTGTWDKPVITKIGSTVIKRAEDAAGAGAKPAGAAASPGAAQPAAATQPEAQPVPADKKGR